MDKFYRVEDTEERKASKKFHKLWDACEYAFTHREKKVLGWSTERTLVTVNDNFNLEYAERFDDLDSFYEACRKLEDSRLN